jgi:hypothetical protein
MIDSKLHIEIALRAGRVAKFALEFAEDTQSALLLRLRYKQLCDEVEDLRKVVAKAVAAEDAAEANRTSPNRPQ